MVHKKLDYRKLLATFAQKYPRFKDGRIDYTSAKESLVIVCFVKYKNKILLLKRSGLVSSYRFKWNTVGGYLDSTKNTPKQQVLIELKEEIGLEKKEIMLLKAGRAYRFHDRQINRVWYVFPYLAELKRKIEIKLNEEHSEFVWIVPKRVTNYNIVPNLEISLEKILTV